MSLNGLFPVQGLLCVGTVTTLPLLSVSVRDTLVKLPRVTESFTFKVILNFSTKVTVFDALLVVEPAAAVKHSYFSGKRNVCVYNSGFDSRYHAGWRG